MRIRKKTVILVVVFLILLIIFFPYIKAEYLTFKYGEQFEGLQQQTHMLTDSRYFKVLSYSENEAQVFYVSYTGDVITFIKTEDGWDLKEWETIWSRTGSADNFYWPYYR